MEAGGSVARDPGDDFWWRSAGPTSVAGPAVSGVYVSEQTALCASAIWGCCKLLSESLAGLPLPVYERFPDGARQRAPNHPLYDRLQHAPNEHMTAFDFKVAMMLALLLRGEAYARIVPGPRGPVDQLLPLPPDRVAVEALPSGRQRYRVTEPDGSQRVLLDDEVWRLLGLTLDGKRGLSVLGYARETIGLSLAAESYGARFFSQDAAPKGVIEYAGVLSLDAKRRLRAAWQEAHAGLGNAYSTAVLDEGMSYKAMGVAPKDAEWVSLREFEVEDICRFFGVPLHLVQLVSKSSSWGSGIESMGIEFVTYALLPWLRRWENGINADLILAPQRFFAEFLVDGLLRGNQKDRYDAYATGRQWGWLSANDVRRYENLNPVAGLDDYLVPVNMAPAGMGPVPPERGAMAVPALAAGATGATIQGFVGDAAARLIRKEQAALGKAAHRCVGQPAAWRAALDAFYAGHRATVAAALRLPDDVAAGYCAAQAAALAAVLPEAVPGWLDGRREALTRLALVAAGVLLPGAAPAEDDEAALEDAAEAEEDDDGHTGHALA
jgi:HK97 family phage portal protein